MIKFLFAILLLFALLSIGVTFSRHDPYTPESISALIAKYNASRSKATLLDYAQQMKAYEKRREVGEPVRASLPDELEIYLVNLVNHGMQNDRKNIIKLYINLPKVTSCCWRIATYGDKTLIGGFLQQAKQLSDEDKLSSLKLIESMRRNKALYKPELHGGNSAESSTINAVFKIYENWWALPLNLDNKLKIDPLKSSVYQWYELE